MYWNRPRKNGGVPQTPKLTPPTPAPVANADNSEDYYWERKGFEALLNKDVQAAITAFNNSEKSHNGFHMVYDIWFYLRKQKTVLQTGDDAAWKNCYRAILTQYSWGMPKSIQAEFKKRIN